MSKSWLQAGGEATDLKRLIILAMLKNSVFLADIQLSELDEFVNDILDAVRSETIDSKIITDAAYDAAARLIEGDDHKLAAKIRSLMSGGAVAEGDTLKSAPGASAPTQAFPESMSLADMQMLIKDLDPNATLCYQVTDHNGGGWNMRGKLKQVWDGIYCIELSHPNLKSLPRETP